jgi:hypothetical protein
MAPPIHGAQHKQVLPSQRPTKHQSATSAAYTTRISKRFGRPMTKNVIYKLMLSAPFDNVRSAIAATLSVATRGRSASVRRACHDAPSPNPPGKENSQEKGIVDIRGREGHYASLGYRTPNEFAETLRSSVLRG